MPCDRLHIVSDCSQTPASATEQMLQDPVPRSKSDRKRNTQGVVAGIIQLSMTPIDVGCHLNARHN